MMLKLSILFIFSFKNIIKDFEDFVMKPFLEQNSQGKMQIHIDLESIKEADGVTEPRQETLGAFGALNSSLNS